MLEWFYEEFGLSATIFERSLALTNFVVFASYAVQVFFVILSFFISFVLSCFCSWMRL